MIRRADPNRTDWDAVQTLIADSFAYMAPILGQLPAAASASGADLARAAQSAGLAGN